jgi:RDD family
VTHVFPVCYASVGTGARSRGGLTRLSRVVDRRSVGGWLGGPGSAFDAAGGGDFPGQRLGLPEHGPGSLARLGSRVQAFVLDAAMCAVIAWGFWRDTTWSTPVFGLEVLVLTTFLGASAGQFLRGLRVVRLDGRPPGLLRSVLRTLLLLLLIPAVIWDRDGRGLHDRAAGTMLVQVR